MIDFTQVPKAELHVHLDGSLRPKTLLSLAKEQNVELPFSWTMEAVETLCFESGSTLEHCLKSFATTLSVMQSKSAIERVVFELCEDLFCDGVTYAEIRYCPTLHTQNGLTRADAIDAVYNGIRDAQDHFPIQARQIVTCLRDLGPSVAREETRAAITSRHKYIVGVDLAGGEAKHPAYLFRDAFAPARSEGMFITIHAGELGTKESLENIRVAVNDIHADRIGHGVALRHDIALQQYLARNGVAVEVCPTSNIHTGAVTSYANHPAAQFHRNGLKIIPCADNTFLSRTTTSREYSMLKECGLSDDELVRIAKDAFEMRFP